MIVAQCHLPDGPDENLSMAAQEITKSIARSKKLFKQLVKHKHDPIAYAKCLKRCMASEAWLVAARFKANARKEFKHRETATQILQGANLAFWDCRPEETVKVRVKPKKDGSFRPICVFGPDFSMMLGASSALLQSIFVPKVWQCDYSGSRGYGGMHHAIQSAASVASEGKLYFGLADIRRFFQSFDVKDCALAFPAHKKIIDAYLGGDYLTMECKPPSGLSVTSILEDARQGGLIGSPLSARMGGLVMSQLKWEEPTILLNYVDDFLILGQSLKEVESGLKALESKISALPGGHFRLHSKGLGHLTKGACFLSHDLLFEGTAVRIRCSLKSQEEFYGELRHLTVPESQLKEIGETTHRHKLVEQLGRSWSYAKSWGEAFKLCEDAEEHVSVVRCVLGVAASNWKIPWSEVQAYKAPASVFTHPYGP